ncbi:MULTISPECIES: 2Fe-2S iron-sulfur cluster-binding protein [unclassified Paenibacillus]|uniref:2Fe-2S iron-sulfur cluster-binding protein n=1 Tax=unclassified Paenibacillus TaxID=185978 RepID=UPI0027D880D5|nr:MULTISPECIES: 2Fe-2S iron-sulfur cluster-binding protein [unclassified Paenibacillus]
MPMIQVIGKEAETFEAEEGKKLVLSLMDQGVDILHRCGGNARCATCRVEIIEGDAGPMNSTEAAIRETKGITEDNIRLSCQIHVHAELTVKPLMTASETGMDPGPRPAE